MDTTSIFPFTDQKQKTKPFYLSCHQNLETKNQKNLMKKTARFWISPIPFSIILLQSLEDEEGFMADPEVQENISK